MNNKEAELYLVLGIKTTDVTYPYCRNCFKKVYYLHDIRGYASIFEYSGESKFG